MNNPITLLPAFQNKKVLRKTDAINIDIIDTIHADLPTAMAQVKELAPTFLGRTRKATAQNIFNFLMKNVLYIKDPEGQQIVKQPNALLAVGGDCKSFALFTVAVLKDLGLPAFFRYASYNVWSKTPTHVYAYTLSETGEPIIIDAVWKIFNEEKKFTFKKDFQVNISSMSGTDIGKAKKPKDKDKPGNAKKVLLAPARAPFLVLVKLNFRGLAHKLSRGIAKSPDKVKAMWSRLGGDYLKLVDAINIGKTKKPLLGEKIQGIAGPELVLAALPVIASMLDLIKKLGVGGGADEGGSPDDILVDTGADKLDPNIKAKDPEPGVDVPDDPNNPNGPGNHNADDFLSNIPMPVKIGGGLLVGYFAAKAFKIIK